MAKHLDTIDLLSEHLRGPERLRGRVYVPGGTYPLAEMFPRNICASGFVPWNIGAAEQIRYDTGSIALEKVVRLPDQ